MALVLEDRVLEVTSTTGTGDLSLVGAVAGYRTFSSALTVGDVLYYTVYEVDADGIPTGAYEDGKGTYSASATLTRTTVIRSSNGNALVNFPAGFKHVALVQVGPVNDTIREDMRQAYKFSKMPQNSQSAAYTLVREDAGKHIFHPSADTTARIWTIPANGTVPFDIGDAITFINQNAAGVITIAITTDTLRLAGSGSTGSRSLAANGVATAVKVAATEWIISGVGLT